MRRLGGLLLSAASHAAGLTLMVAVPLLTDAGGPPPVLSSLPVIPDLRVALPVRSGPVDLAGRRPTHARGARPAPRPGGPWVVSPSEEPGVGDASAGDPLAWTKGEDLCPACPADGSVPGGFVSGDLLAAAGPPRPLPLRPGGLVTQPRRIHYVAPIYPELARAARVEGRVVIDCVIDSTGRVVEANVASGHPLLDGAALDAVRQWTYTPTLLNGVPVSVLLTVTVAFGLR
jgi:periplasmic protein TonB